MKIALTSMDIQWEQPSVNREKCVELIKRASDSGARLILFPEMTLTGFTMNTGQFGETPGQDGTTGTIRFFLEESKRWKLAVGFGYIRRIPEHEKCGNHYAVVDRGVLLGDYKKIHPFSYGSEPLYYEGGNQLVTVEIDRMRMGLFLCYDLRFPEIFRTVCGEVNLFAVAANWPESRIRHWHCLLQARAVENQSIVLGVNRKGAGNGLFYPPSSEGFDEQGMPLEIKSGTTSYGDECLLCDVDLEKVNRARREFPVLQDRRIQLYQRII